MSYRVIGIDQSLTSTGVTRVVDGRIATMIVKTAGHKGDTLSPRLERIRSSVRRIRDFALDGYVPEEGAPSPLFMVEAPLLTTPKRRDPKTGQLVPIEGGGHAWDRAGAWWLLVHLLSKDGPVAQVDQAVVKRYVTGSGGSGKEAVTIAVARMFPDVQPMNNDIADSVALAAMGQRRLGRPIEPSSARITDSALDRIVWPSVVERPPMPE